MEEITWVNVTETSGLTVAEMLAKRLEAAEIPAQAVQESAGRAIGLIGGPLGTAYVRVPVQYLEEARELLDVDDPIDADNVVNCPNCDSELELDEAEWEQGWFVCPVCEVQTSLNQVTCPNCDSELELDEAEWEQGWFVCPVCEMQTSLDELLS